MIIAILTLLFDLNGLTSILTKRFVNTQQNVLGMHRMYLMLNEDLELSLMKMLRIVLLKPFNVVQRALSIYSDTQIEKPLLNGAAF